MTDKIKVNGLMRVNFPLEISAKDAEIILDGNVVDAKMLRGYIVENLDDSWNGKNAAHIRYPALSAHEIAASEESWGYAGISVTDIKKYGDKTELHLNALMKYQVHISGFEIKALNSNVSPTSVVLHEITEELRTRVGKMGGDTAETIFLYDELGKVSVWTNNAEKIYNSYGEFVDRQNGFSHFVNVEIRKSPAERLYDRICEEYDAYLEDIKSKGVDYLIDNSWEVMWVTEVATYYVGINYDGIEREFSKEEITALLAQDDVLECLCNGVFEEINKDELVEDVLRSGFETAIEQAKSEMNELSADKDGRDDI